MVKPTLSHAELLRRVRLLFEAHPAECGGVSLDGLEIRDDQSAIANWHVAWVRATGSESAIQACQLKIRDELAALRDAYDCEPPQDPDPDTPSLPRLW